MWAYAQKERRAAPSDLAQYKKKPPDLAPGDFAAHAKFRLLLLPSGPDKIHGMTSHETRWSSIRRQFILYHAFSGIASPILRGDGKARICLGLMRLPALTRRCAALLYMIVDRRPAQYRVWPVAAPAEAFVRAGLVCAALCVRTCWLKRGREYRFSLLFIMEDGVYKGGSCEVCLGHCAVMRAFGVLRCGSVGGHAGHTALLKRFAFDHAGHVVLSKCFAFDHAGLRFCRSVLRSITPAVCRIAPNRTACEMLRSYFAVGRDRQ